MGGSLDSDVVKAADVIRGSENVYVAPLDNKTVAGYFVLKDLLGKPSFIVSTSEKRILYEHGKSTIRYIFVALFIVGTVLCGVMLLFMKRTILTRLKSLTFKVEQITDSSDIAARLPLSEHNDELKTLAVSINSMLQSLENVESNLRDSEERYRMLFDRAPDGIIIIGMEGDEAGRIVAANQAAAEQHGYTVDELKRLRIYDLNTPETNKIAGELFAEIGKGDWVTAEIWHQKKDGTQFPIEIHVGLIKINGKRYNLGFDRDITQRKITEETKTLHLQQITQLNDELALKATALAVANSELEAFNFSVSHDMRGPLTRISGYCQLMLDDDSNLDPVVRGYVTRIYESEMWLNDMIDALMQLAQLARVETVLADVNLTIIADAALKELSLEYSDRRVRTKIEADIVVAGDSRLLKMAMINLLNNAWKYSSGKSEALIEFGVDQSGIIPVYYVRDNGAGFNMKEAGKLFRVFSRLHDSSQFAGTGIGLATVQRIISRHGGKIWAEAEPGVGATFFFTLP
jgi:PAS domain S-box-containing protein